MWLWQEILLQKFVKFGVNLKFFAPWLPWQRLPFWIFSTTQKLPHTMVDILTKFHEVWWKESKFFFNPPFFVSMATAAKFFQPIPIFFGLSRSTRCGCDRKHYCKDLWNFSSEFKKNCTLVTMATAAILNFLNPKSCHTLQWIFLQSFMKFDEKN